MFRERPDNLFENTEGPVGRYAPETSKIAARLQRMKSGTQRELICRAYWHNPEGLTDEEAFTIAQIPHTSSPWARCYELRAWGVIEPTGDVRPTRNRSSVANVNKLTALGIEILTPVYAPGGQESIDFETVG